MKNKLFTTTLAFLVALAVFLPVSPVIDNGNISFVPTTAEASGDIKTTLDNIVSHWEYEETSGTRYDSHGSNNLTDNNTVDYSTSGIQGNAADFEYANSEYLSLSDASQTGLEGTGDWSVSVWLKPESFQSNNFLFGKDNGTTGQKSYNFNYGTNKMTLTTFNSSGSKNVATCSPTLSAGNWYHIVITYDASSGGNGIAMYLNGTSQTMSVLQDNHTAVVDGSSAFWVGNRSSGGANYVDGLVEEFTFTSDIISASEVTSVYNSGSGISYDNGGGGGGERRIIRTTQW